MFCNNCGNQISPEQTFCQFCGAPTNTSSVKYQVPPQQPNFNAMPPQPPFNQAFAGDNIIRQIPSDMLAKQFFWAIISGIVVAVCGTILLLLAPDDIGSSVSLVSSGIVLTAASVWNYILARKRYYMIKEYSICGVTGGYTLNIYNEEFNLRYTDIASAKLTLFKNQIIISTKQGKKFRLQMPQQVCTDAFAIIQGKINQFNQQMYY